MINEVIWNVAYVCPSAPLCVLAELLPKPSVLLSAVMLFLSTVHFLINA